MKYWFKAKTYGYGWTPATWQGWLVLAAYIGLSVATFVILDAQSYSTSDALMAFFPIYFLFTCSLLLTCAATGETLHWRWGKKD